MYVPRIRLGARIARLTSGTPLAKAGVMAAVAFVPGYRQALAAALQAERDEIKRRAVEGR
ncbi:hypothetical protein EDC02_5926 [Micromonospora sp. Llam0]|nr:hypothetical protein EDC02_5926 [Micromonospora sp. Llam0]